MAEYTGQRKPRDDDPDKWEKYYEKHPDKRPEPPVKAAIKKPDPEPEPVVVVDRNLSDEDYFQKYDNDLYKTHRRLIESFPKWLIEAVSTDMFMLHRRPELKKRNNHGVSILTTKSNEAFSRAKKRQPTEVGIGDCFWSMKFKCTITISGLAQSGDELFVLLGNRYSIITVKDLNKMDLQVFKSWNDKRLEETVTIKVRR